MAHACVLGIGEGLTELLPNSGTGPRVSDPRELLGVKRVKSRGSRSSSKIGAILEIAWEYNHNVADLLGARHGDPAVVLSQAFRDVIKACSLACVPIAVAFIVQILMSFWAGRNHYRVCVV